MARQANSTIGKVRCAFCGAVGEVRRNIKGKLYYYCPSDGIIQPTLPPFQDWIEAHMQPIEPEAPAEPERDEPPPAPAAQEPETEAEEEPEWLI